MDRERRKFETEEDYQRRYDEEIRRYKRSTFGERYIDTSLAKTDLPEWAQEKLVRFMTKPKNFLIFFGSPGIGKTFFCACLTEWIAKNFDSFRYFHEKDLLQKLREIISESKGDYLKHLHHIIDV